MVDLAASGLRFYALSVILYGVNNAFVNYTQGVTYVSTLDLNIITLRI